MRTLGLGFGVALAATWALLGCGGGDTEPPDKSRALAVQSAASSDDVLAERAADLRPLKPGSVWHYAGVHQPEDGGSATTYQATIRQFRRPDGTLVEERDNVLGEADEPFQLLINDDGHVVQRALPGTSEATAPVVELRSPVRRNDRYPLARLSGLTLDDIDGDGRADTAELALSSTVVGAETVTVEAVDLTVRAVRVDTTALLRVTQSSDGTTLPVINSVRSTWYAPGWGVVRQQITARSARGIGPVVFEEWLTGQVDEPDAGSSPVRRSGATAASTGRGQATSAQRLDALIERTVRRMAAPGLLAVARAVGRSPVSDPGASGGAQRTAPLDLLDTGGAVNEPWEEYTRHVKRAEEISPHGSDVAGDSIQLQSGALSLRAVDVSLPGNGALPVQVVRTFSTKSVSFTLRAGIPQGHNALDSAFGDWELDLPWVGGTFARSTGWINPVDGMAARRCSVTSPSEAVAPWAKVGQYWFSGHDIWSGTRLNIPGRGTRTMLVRGASTPKPSGGGTWITADWTSVSCLDTIPGASGEGFVATDANGVTYRLDWLAVSEEPSLAKHWTSNYWGSGYVLLERGQHRLYATHVQDRHGNWVKYTYDNAHDQPVRLKRIESSDGRVITFTHVNNRIETATAHGKVWRYAYSPTEGALTTVTLPDNTAWTLDLPNFQNLSIGYRQGEPGDPWRSCGEPGEIYERSYLGTVTHPGGAKVSFTVEPRRFVRREVTTPGNCAIGDPSDPNDDSEYHPTAWDAYAVIKKSITGPGLPSATWTYTYNLGDSTEVVGPGEYARYTFGNRFRKDEGKQLRVERGRTASLILNTQTSDYELAQTGMPYATPIGGSGHDRSGHFDEEYPRPQKSNLVSRQGVTLQWSASSFDRFARPLTITRSSTANGNPTRTETTTYHDNLSLWVLGQVDKVTSGGLTMVDYTYNADALPTQKLAFGVLQWSQTYHPDGLLHTRTDGRDHTTTFTGYKRGIPQSVLYPTQATESAVVDNLGQITSHRSASGHTTGYAYDAMGRLSAITPPTGFTATSLAFEPVAQAEFGLPAGHWRQTIQKGAARTVTYLDALWRPVLTRSFDSNAEDSTRKVVVKAFDANNRVVYQSQPQRSVAAYTDRPPGTYSVYDALGRIVKVTNDSELGLISTTTAYLSGLKVRTTDPRLHSTTHTLWALDDPEQSHISAISAPEGVAVTIARDAFGKPLSITRNGLTRAYVYDAGQRLCKTIEPEIGATVQDYDAAGNLAWRAPGQDLPSLTSCDRAEVADSAKISHTHDPMNRPLVTSYGDASPSVTRTWWPDGKLRTVASHGATWTYFYNALRLLTTERMDLDGTTYTFTWGYTPDGTLDSLTYPDNSVVSYQPNALGEPTQAGTYASNVQQHANGMLSAYNLGNGKRFVQTLNTRGLPELISHPGVAVERYAYDVNGNVGSITDEYAGTFSRSMTYDALNRLSTASAPNAWGEASYTYDPLDNIETAVVGSRASTLHYDARNRLEKIVTNGATSDYQYDERGNIRIKGEHSYTFDLANRLRESDPGGSYRYDGHGRRTRLQGTDGSIRRQFYSQAGQLLWAQQTGGTGPAKTAYVYLGQRLIAEVNDGTPTYVHSDALGSPLARTNASGAVVTRTRHEPFGAVTSGTKPNPATGVIGFTGHVQDDKTELVYMQQRYYDPIAGRFLSVDPVVTDAATGKQFGRYTYVDNNPYSKIDPDGCDPTINYGPNATKLSTISETIIKNAMMTAKVDSLTVTSVYRSPEDQARVMYNNTEKNGVEAQNKLYGKEGKEVIKTYSDAKDKKLDKADTISKMADVVKDNVSAFKHSSDPSKLQAVDIDPGSLKGGDRKDFEGALQKDKGVSNVFLPPKDPAIHVEIPQK